MADDGLPHARSQAFLRRHLLPSSVEGRTGGLRTALLQKVREEWAKNRESIESAADRITQYLRQQQASGEQTASWDETLFHRSFKAFQSSYDKTYGGFGSAPKFPRASTFVFLSSYAWSYGSRPALDMLTQTLQAMARGGIHDHVGGGFHRYSTDKRWFLPHFEKMLYDQAQIAQAFLQAYQLSGDASFAEVAKRIYGYVLRDMQHPDGGFYSAEDADSLPPGSSAGEKREGAFYVWSADKLRDLLGPDHSLFASQFGVRAGRQCRERSIWRVQQTEHSASLRADHWTRRGPGRAANPLVRQTDAGATIPPATLARRQDSHRLEWPHDFSSGEGLPGL